MIAKNEVKAELEKIRRLKDGWSNGRGKAYNEHEIARAEAFIYRLLAEYPETPMPKIYPNSDKEFLLEWGNSKDDSWGVIMTLKNIVSYFELEAFHFQERKKMTVFGHAGLKSFWVGKTTEDKKLIENRKFDTAFKSFFEPKESDIETK